MYNWLIGNMGTEGNFDYTAVHLYSAAVVLVVLVAVILLGASKKLDRGHKRALLLGISIFQLVFEVTWRLIYLLVKKDHISCWWPLYPCNLGGILVPLIALLNLRWGKQMFYLFAFVGACITFAVPDGIYCRDVLVFPILKSILQHTGIMLIPALEYAGGTYRPTLKDMGWVFCGLLVHTVNSEGIVRLMGFTGDYMFLRGTLPFVIPGVPQFITLGVFALLVLILLSWLCDIKGSNAFLKQRLTKRKAAVK